MLLDIAYLDANLRYDAAPPLQQARIRSAPCPVGTMMKTGPLPGTCLFLFRSSVVACVSRFQTAAEDPSIPSQPQPVLSSRFLLEF